MHNIAITDIKLDESGRLLVVPDLGPGEDFAFVYRAAMGISWCPEDRALLSPALRPGGWSYSDWFKQIQRAAADEYGVTLAVNGSTTWSVPEDVRKEIESSCK